MDGLGLGLPVGGNGPGTEDGGGTKPEGVDETLGVNPEGAVPN